MFDSCRWDCCRLLSWIGTCSIHSTGPFNAKRIGGELEWDGNSPMGAHAGWTLCRCPEPREQLDKLEYVRACKILPGAPVMRTKMSKDVINLVAGIAAAREEGRCPFRGRCLDLWKQKILRNKSYLCLDCTNLCCSKWWFAYLGMSIRKFGESPKQPSTLTLIC
jgi:hypothetical protein